MDAGERSTKRPAAPRLEEGLALEPVGASPADDVAWFERRVEGDVLAKSALAAPVLERCRFERADVADSTWKRARLLDVELDGGDAANARWLEAAWRRVRARSVRMTGFDGSDGRYEDVAFEDCRLDYAFFQRARFKTTRFERCNLQSAELEGADLRGAVLRDCDLSNANLVRARLVGADLRGSRLEELVATPADLRGAIVGVGQLPELATVLGMDVRP